MLWYRTLRIDALRCNSISYSRGLPVTKSHDFPDLADQIAATVNIQLHKVIIHLTPSVAEPGPAVLVLAHSRISARPSASAPAFVRTHSA
ncbi:hypothetical protein VM1G_06658 [Cytospora mali]|uniref:Uncharacterized protein n=1 Tax=Cytospora mali TaxID=578113 RepID=A0A194W6E9_CYTMA|nr:hypothetical protein VM1G_06658 [Valsa mali]